MILYYIEQRKFISFLRSQSLDFSSGIIDNSKVTTKSSVDKTMEKFLALSAFSFHLSLWYVFQNYNKTNYSWLTIEELSTKKTNNIKKSDSEYSLGLNRSDSISASLNQMGTPCFMNWTVKDVFTILIYENIDSILMMVSSAAFAYYTMFKKYDHTD
jgi:hypothetical protein